MSDLLIVAINDCLTRLDLRCLFPEARVQFSIGVPPNGSMPLPHHLPEYQEFSSYHNFIKVAVVTDSFMLAHALDLSWFDHVVVLDIELSTITPDRYVRDLRVKYNNPNIHLVISAISMDHSKGSDTYIYPLFVRAVNIVNKDTTFEYMPNRLKMFDALLGLRKSHRQYVFEQLVNTGLIDQSYVSYQKNTLSEPPETMYCSPELLKIDEPIATSIRQQNNNNYNSYSLSVNAVNGHMYMASHRIPVQVYNNSYYSIVTETNEWTYPFVTEKTAKPMLAKRVFVVFGCCGYLETLRSFGFQTFENIIDESFDQIKNPEQRWAAAFEQVVRLSKMDPTEVYKKAESALEHNRNLVRDPMILNLPLSKWLNDRIIK